jgi:pyruvate dehydrogenase E1 component alpha subunit
MSTALPGRGHALHLLTQMLRIRRFEERAAELYSAGKIRGFLHLYIGEEAVATGALRAYTDDDALLCTYREHGHALVRGVPMNTVMAEMYGKQEGCSRGRGGSMHLFDADHRFYGGNAIVAGHLPVAVGMGLGDKLAKRNRVTVCFFGEGAVAEGEFHESLNLAALWRLPVVFACENNGYAMGTALERSESQTSLCVKAASYGIPAVSIDGMDVVEVESETRRVVDGVRAGGGPAFIEYRTYRFRAHSMFDAELYRDKSEVEMWRKRDPISSFLKRMVDAGTLTDEDLAHVEDKVMAELDEAVAFAEAGTWEPIEELTRDVYTEVT